MVKEGAKLVDVRSPGEFSSGHLPGAINVPLQELGAQVKKLGEKDKPVVLYCASGTRSAMACSTLKGLGFTQVFNLGSMGRW
ncbi:MAG: rhodanese-like domain-containing protein [Archangiaceae bacterium]|nr:rhodanese-like domain-containing protein [Archangiaceae bacterium]